jgi:hypothetical protein
MGRGPLFFTTRNPQPQTTKLHHTGRQAMQCERSSFTKGLHHMCQQATFSCFEEWVAGGLNHNDQNMLTLIWQLLHHWTLPKISTTQKQGWSRTLSLRSSID